MKKMLIIIFLLAITVIGWLIFQNRDLLRGLISIRSASSVNRVKLRDFYKYYSENEVKDKNGNRVSMVHELVLPSEVTKKYPDLAKLYANQPIYLFGPPIRYMKGDSNLQIEARVDQEILWDLPASDGVATNHLYFPWRNAVSSSGDITVIKDKTKEEIIAAETKYSKLFSDKGPLIFKTRMSLSDAKVLGFSGSANKFIWFDQAKNIALVVDLIYSSQAKSIKDQLSITEKAAENDILVNTNKSFKSGDLYEYGSPEKISGY